MSNTNPYQSNSASTATPKNRSWTLFGSACLGAVSAGLGPFLSSLFFVVAAVRDPTSSPRGSNVIQISIISTLLAAGLGALVGIAIGMFRRAMVRDDRKIVE